jgi:hypothetical protein
MELQKSPEWHKSRIGGFEMVLRNFPGMNERTWDCLEKDSDLHVFGRIVRNPGLESK